MDINEYQQLSRRTQNKSLTQDERRQHALYCLASEAGEVLGLHQKVFQGHDLDAEKLDYEIGDVLWAVSELCDAYGLKMGDVAQHNIDKLRRRYPAGFDAERSLHREGE